MRYPASEKLEIIRLVEQSHLPAKQTLDKLGIPRTGSVRRAERGRSVASLDEKSIPLFQQFTRSDPPDGDDVCPISLIAAPGRGPAVRAWHRHLS